MGRRNVFVVGLDEAHRQHLEQVSAVREACELHPVLSPCLLREWRCAPLQSLYERALESMERLGRPVDAITGFGPFPVAPLVAMLCRHYGVPGPSLESVVASEHRCWSRLLQGGEARANVLPLHTFDAFEDHSLASFELEVPFVVRPVSRLAEHLSFRVASARDLEHALSRLREQLPAFVPAFEDLLAHVELPAGLAAVDVGGCVAEPIVGGRRCRVEAHAFHGEVHSYGVVDLVPHPLEPTVARCEYPSRLPFPLQDDLKAIVGRVGRDFGFSNTAFRVEFVGDPVTQDVWVSEVDVGPAHVEAELFEMVDGRSGYAVAIDLALGRRPSFIHGRGRFGCAAKFMLRTVNDAVVTRIPTADELERIRAKLPSAHIVVRAAAGDRRTRLPERVDDELDLAWICIGGVDPERVHADYEACKPMLRFDFSDPHTRWH